LRAHNSTGWIIESQRRSTSAFQRSISLSLSLSVCLSLFLSRLSSIGGFNKALVRILLRSFFSSAVSVFISQRIFQWKKQVLRYSGWWYTDARTFKHLSSSCCRKIVVKSLAIPRQDITFAFILLEAHVIFCFTEHLFTFFIFILDNYI